jgi:hypothetical protein
MDQLDVTLPDGSSRRVPADSRPKTSTPSRQGGASSRRRLSRSNGSCGGQEALRFFGEPDRLAAAGLRVELDDRQKTIRYKIREAQRQKVPSRLVTGDREAAEGLWQNGAGGRGPRGAQPPHFAAAATGGIGRTAAVPEQQPERSAWKRSAGLLHVTS